jgi:hypothetical protein
MVGRATVAVLAVVAVLALGACGGGGGDDGDSATEARSGSTTTTASAEGGADDAETEVPKFLGDYERVCTTQVGFAGASAYEEAPGVHPVVLFEDYRGEGFVQSSRSLPAGWAVTEDSDYEDTSDLAKAQLIACSDRTKETPTGKRCTFKGDKDAKEAKDRADVELELVDATYEHTVYEARTGEKKTTTTLEAHDADCPFIATFKTGDTTFVSQPSDDEYTAALKAIVTGTPSS